VVVAREVEDAVHDRLLDVVGEFWTDDDVTELPRPGDRRGFVHGERKDVGRLVTAPEATVELANARSVDEHHAQVAFQPDRIERDQGGPPELSRHLEIVARGGAARGYRFFAFADRRSGA
jgi:hypothetical protein